MSDAPEQKKGWFNRLREGLSRTSKQMTETVVSTILLKRQLDDEALEELEELLIMSDLGPEAAERITRGFAEARFGMTETEAHIKGALADAIARELQPFQGRFDPLSGPKPYVVLFVGVNGSGKTTTLGKIAADLTRRGRKVLVVAGDTFRAAAVEQLKVWADRAGAAFEGRELGADAAGLAYDAYERAKREGFDVVLVDTAGRLQNKSGLMDELSKTVRALKKLDPAAPHEVLLVLDATAGRNAISQAEGFDKTAGVTGLVMTKLDGTARGGVLVAAAEKYGLPIHAIGVGETLEDLRPFDANEVSRIIAGVERVK